MLKVGGGGGYIKRIRVRRDKIKRTNVDATKECKKRITSTRVIYKYEYV